MFDGRRETEGGRDVRVSCSRGATQVGDSGVGRLFRSALSARRLQPDGSPPLHVCAHGSGFSEPPSYTPTLAPIPAELLRPAPNHSRGVAHTYRTGRGRGSGSWPLEVKGRRPDPCHSGSEVVTPMADPAPVTLGCPSPPVTVSIVWRHVRFLNSS